MTSRWLWPLCRLCTMLLVATTRRRLCEKGYKKQHGAQKHTLFPRCSSPSRRNKTSFCCRAFAVLDTLDAINSCRWISSVTSSVITLPTDDHRYLLRGYFSSAFVFHSGVSVPLVGCCNVFRSMDGEGLHLLTLCRHQRDIQPNSCASRRTELL